MATTASEPTTAFGRIGTWCSTTTFGSTRWQRGLAAVITALMFWPQASVDAAIGPDQSTLAGVALARIHHLEWGPEIVLTYGPLAFLQNTPYYSFDQSLLATIYQPVIVAALFLGIAAALRQRHAPMTSLLGAFLTTGIVAILHIGHGGVSGLEYNEMADLAALAWAAVPLLQHDPKRSTVFTTCTVLGAVAGLQLLVKLNAGIAIVAIALALSLLLDWRAVGRHCATVTAFAASTFIWWVLDGQPPGNLPAWLRSSAALASGYSAAENDPTLLNVVAVVLILAWIGALWVMFIRGAPEIPQRLVVLLGLATLIPAKSALAKPDIWHLYAVLSLAVVAVAITPLFGTRGRALVVVVLATTLVLLGAEYAVVVLAGGYPSDTSRIAEALRAPAQAVDRLVTLALPGRVDKRVAQAKARQRALYAIPDRFIKTIGSSTVHVDPYETSAAWAYDLTWRPAPVYQTSAAYMPALDDLNSESLAKGPDFILSRQSPASPATGVGGMGGRLGVEESPRYSRALLCNYTLTGVENRWALFTHTGPHCGPLTALSKVTVHGNDVIAVPAPSGPNMAVLVGIDLEPTVVDRLLQGTVAPPTAWTVVLDGITYRLIGANAAEPFLLNTPVQVDGTNLQIDAHTIGVGHTSSMGQQGAVRLRFYEMRVGP
jgi:hypothetical protein